MPARKKKRRKTAFVPRVVFATAVVGVAAVPACVAACGGLLGGSGGVAAVAFTDGGPPGSDGGADGVATAVFADVATTGFDGVAVTAFGVALETFGDVATTAFDGGGEAAADAFGFDASPADASDGSDDRSD